MKAAYSLKLPYILHESNAFPGLSVRLTAKKAYKVMLGFKEAKERLNNLDNLVVTGNIAGVSKDKYDSYDKDECKKELNIDKNKKVVFVTFGSQGAKYLNDYIIQMAKNQSKEIFFILVTGKNNYDEVLEKINRLQSEENIDMSKYIRIEKFVYDMAKMYKIADLCITRSGAMTITELEEVKVPAILIPLPTAAENHQYYNAKVLKDIGAASIIEQKDLNKDNLYSKVLEMLTSIVQKRSVNSYDKLKNENVSDNILNVIETFNKRYTK